MNRNHTRRHVGPVQKYNIGAHGLPNIELPDILMTLRHGGHTQGQADIDRYGRAAIPGKVNLSKMQDAIIEVEIEDETNEVVKILLRTPNVLADGSDCPQYDRTVVVMFPDYFIKTIWLNDINDDHKTLKMSEFKKKPDLTKVYKIKSK